MPPIWKSVHMTVVYNGSVTTNSSVKQCIGATERTIKQRLYNPKLPFANRKYTSNTSLSSYIWHLKDMNVSPTIVWEILKLAPAGTKTSRKYLFCLHEKLAIITDPSQNTLLNKKSDILSKYRHGNSHLLLHCGCISHSTNTLGKGMNPIILPPAMGK